MPTRIRRLVIGAFAPLACLGLVPTAHAGELILTNMSTKPITCKVDGYPRPFAILPAVQHHFPPNLAAREPIIDSVDCGNLRPRLMHITLAGPDHVLVLNGQQTRTLNAFLYAYIPTLNNSFSSLASYIISTYQAQNPQVLLNLVIDPSVNVYDFATLQKLAGPGGYDVLEVDMSLLGFLVSNNLITPASIMGDQPFPVARQTATFNGTLYAIPSWLCSNFFFYFSNDPKEKLTLRQIKAARGDLYDRILVSDFDGSWTITAMYLMTYVQLYGYANLNQAFTMPPDPPTIQTMIGYPLYCNGSGGNPCIDGTYHNAPDGTVERAFATGQALVDIGFSERSFFVNLYDTVPGTLLVAPVEWSQPLSNVLLLYTDGFVTNSSTCSTGTCVGDTQAFTTLMTGAAMKTYIAFSQDLPSGTPPRHLLVATQPFWSQSVVQNDPLYSQLAPVVNGTGYELDSFPNFFTPAQKQAVSTGVCAALQAKLPNYACSTSAPAAR